MSLAKSREQITTRVDAAVREVIEREAVARRTTPAQMARVLLEDAARELADGHRRSECAACKGAQLRAHVSVATC